MVHNKKSIILVARGLEELDRLRAALPPEHGAEQIALTFADLAPQGFWEVGNASAPALIIVSCALVHIDTLCTEISEAGIDSISKDLGNRGAGITQAIAQLAALRIRENWIECPIVVWTETDECSDDISQVLWWAGADDVVLGGATFASYLPVPAQSASAGENLPPKRQPKVLMAENHVETALLVEVLLKDLCDIELAVNNQQGRLRDVSTLNADTVAEYLARGGMGFDAVVVDMALSPHAEQAAELHVTKTGARSVRLLEEHLEGFAVLRHIRRFFPHLPMCVFSNYVADPTFGALMARVLGENTYNSIAVFTKNPEGRNGLKAWMKRLSERLCLAGVTDGE